MAPTLAEDVDQQVGCAVDDLRLLAEVGCAVDHAEQLDDSLHLVEITDLRLERRQHIQAHQLSCLITGFDVEDLSNLSAVSELAVAGWPVAGDEDQISGSHRTNILS